MGRSVLVTIVGRNGSQELYRTSTYMRVQDAAASTPVALSVRYTGPGIRGRVATAAGAPLPSIAVALKQGNSSIAGATTEADGTYLFVGRPTGLYQVEPTPPAG
ncbi:MAG: carboxypeptidase regulatory-like domain-containing protein [Gemmatimonadetes bacterium]|nr:carboxypeptidase regulatory-like domain-containing protein [Gemmatimonadota bacterium]